MAQLIAEIVIDGAAVLFDKRYSYAVPEELRSTALSGSRVTVPFGGGNLSRQGMIMSVKEGEAGEKTKSILTVCDATPVLSDEMLKLCEWMKEHTFCTYFDAIRAMLPAGLSYKLTDYYSINPEFVSPALLSGNEAELYTLISEKGEISREKIEKLYTEADELLASLEEKEAVVRCCTPVRRMGDMTRRWVRLADDAEPALKLTPRQREITELVEMSGEVSVKELQYFTGVSVSVIDALVKKGILVSFEKEEFRTPYRLKSVTKSAEINLSDQQQEAFLGLKAKCNAKKGSVNLLYGVTGSGKTQVFLKLCDEVIASGRGVIVMVPEIALTPQMIEIFSSRYGSKTAVLHSAMSIGQRMDEYKRIKKGKALIAIGTRSAVFAPFEDLGLIIMDEEQEHTYKSEKSPRFHAREIARFRAAYHKCPLILASATPSVESYSAAKSGKYDIFTLSHRYGDALLPEVHTVDMRKELCEGNSGALSRELTQAISDELEQKKQIILLLNRRGHNTHISCPTCGWTASCPNCSISLTYHSANGRMLCHYCGYSEKVTRVCPECSGEHIKFMGLGTQKVEEDLKLLFPNARVLRLDADSTMNRDSYSVKLSAFAAGEYDILLGTQMVAKGLDFPNVSLVGVIGADRAAYSDDYRAFERTFSLLTQVVGRAGRAGGGGRAIIQTTDPQNTVISLAQNQDYDGFYSEEILTRRLMVYPPYCDICVVAVKSADNALSQAAAMEIFENIKGLTADEFCDVKLMILGPCPASIPKVNNRYRYRMMIKCRNNARFREMLRLATAIKPKRDVSVWVDIDPETII